MRPAAVAAIVPCRNEAQSIARVLAELDRIGVTRVVVGLDPASTDETASIAAAAGALVARSQTSGYDGPCLAAIAALRDEGYGDHVLFLDAGDKYVMDTIGALLDDLDPHADLTMGTRDAQMRWHQRAGNTMFKVVLWVRYRTWIHDVSSVRVLTMATLHDLQLHDRQFSLPFQTIVNALAQGKPIRCVPVRCTSQRAGRSMVSGNWRNSAKAARQMLRSLFGVPR